jgi:hypothetical protein
MLPAISVTSRSPLRTSRGSSVINTTGIRHNPALVASLLFTIALLFYVPDSWRNAAYTGGTLWQAGGFASLAIILVGLVVVWTGFMRRDRWAWLMMFIIVWVWFFPLFVLPIFQGKIAVTFLGWFKEAWNWPGSARDYGENIVLFSVMILALLLPMKSFFWTKKRTA